MELKCKRKEVLNIYRKFKNQSLLSLPGRKFTYFLEKNEGRLESILKEQESKLRREYEKRGEVPQEFMDEEKAVIEKHAFKNEKGEVFDQRGNYQIPAENIEAFEKEMDELYTKHGELGEKIRSYIKTMEEYSEEEITIDIHHIKEEDLPDTINKQQRDIIKEFIVD